MQQQPNPFSNWSKKQHQNDIQQLEHSFLNQAPLNSFGNKQPLASKSVQDVSLGVEQDKQFVEQLAQVISDKLIQAIDSKELLVDRAKLEELKVDNQLMARHIYSLIQNRDIQNKQMNHLQKEQGRMKKLFWKFYLQQ